MTMIIFTWPWAPLLQFSYPNITINIRDSMAVSLTLHPSPPKTDPTELLRDAGVPFIGDLLTALEKRVSSGPSWST